MLGSAGFKQQLVQQGLTERKQQAESLHSELLRLRDEYEAANPGRFELIHPSPHQKLQSMYERMLHASRPTPTASDDLR